MPTSYLKEHFLQIAFAGALGVIYLDKIDYELWNDQEKSAGWVEEKGDQDDQEAGSEVRSVFGHFKAVTGLCLHSTGSDKGYNLMLSSSEDFSVRVWATCSTHHADSIQILQCLDIN